MRSRVSKLLAFMMLTYPLFSQTDIPSYVLAGSYELKGRIAGSEKMFKGKVTIANNPLDNHEVTLERKIGKKMITGRGVVEGKNLLVEWVDGKQNYIGLLSITFDNDSYAIFTGSIYETGGFSVPSSETWSVTGLEPGSEIAPTDGDGWQLLMAEARAAVDGRKVLATAREMTLIKKEILPGSCWDYVNAVFDRAGYPYANRKTVFKSVKSGPYADLALVQPGDWLYFINHSYGDIEHSSMFVSWSDFDRKTGLMLSYGGEGRHEPARYLDYDLTHVFMIIRPSSGK
ncbi:MAG: hypothetical protein KDC45_12220 [Bacteroidetes bacterium]|nr:hypothetical protein [Bacteroidota bacterium]